MDSLFFLTRNYRWDGVKGKRVKGTFGDRGMGFCVFLFVIPWLFALFFSFLLFFLAEGLEFGSGKLGLIGRIAFFLVSIG